MAAMRSRQQRGSAMVEGALVLGVLIFTLIGIMDFAQMLFLHQSIVERVRGAARAAVVEQLSNTQTQNLVVYGKKDPVSGQTGFFGLTPSNVLVTIGGGGTGEGNVRIRVTGLRFPVLSPLMSRSGKSLPIQVVVPLEEP